MAYNHITVTNFKGPNNSFFKPDFQVNRRLLSLLFVGMFIHIGTGIFFYFEALNLYGRFIYAYLVE